MAALGSWFTLSGHLALQKKSVLHCRIWDNLEPAHSSIPSVKTAVDHSSFSVMCFPPVAFPSLARGRAVLCRIWRWWPLLTTTYTYFSANLTIKIVPQILPVSFKSVISCKAAAFENKMLSGRRGCAFCLRGFRPGWNLSLVSLLFLALWDVYSQTELWKWARHHTQRSNSPAPSSAKWWHHLCLCVWQNLWCLIRRQTELPLGSSNVLQPHVHMAFTTFTAYKRQYFVVCYQFVCLFLLEESLTTTDFYIFYEKHHRTRVRVWAMGGKSNRLIGQ